MNQAQILPTSVWLTDAPPLLLVLLLWSVPSSISAKAHRHSQSPIPLVGSMNASNEKQSEFRIVYLFGQEPRCQKMKSAHPLHGQVPRRNHKTRASTPPP